MGSRSTQLYYNPTPTLQSLLWFGGGKQMSCLPFHLFYSTELSVRESGSHLAIFYTLINILTLKRGNYSIETLLSSLNYHNDRRMLPRCQHSDIVMTTTALQSAELMKFNVIHYCHTLRVIL